MLWTRGTVPWVTIPGLRTTMAGKWNPKRRRFLEAAAAVAAAAQAGCSGDNTPWRTLTAREAETAAAVADCLIPADDYPAAARAGAVEFFDRQLTGYLRHHRAAYREGLAALDRAAGGRFAGFPQDRQAALLQEVEKGKASVAGWPSSAQTQFFALIRAHTMQSFYGDPRHGGNRDQVGDRMIGIPMTPVRGRSQHDLTKPEAKS
jgi:gluconate 2-dehydrogenase gamma chain